MFPSHFWLLHARNSFVQRHLSRGPFLGVHSDQIHPGTSWVTFVVTWSHGTSLEASPEGFILARSVSAPSQLTSVVQGHSAVVLASVS